MKKLMFALIIAFCFPLLACNATVNKDGNAGSELNPAGIMVYYFHNERRCATCVAVEDETKKALNELYAARMKSGEITFQSINLEEKSGENLANSLKVAGQTLLIVSGNKQTDLTDKAFLYARSNPEKLKAEVKKAVDAALK